jgi:hypothetical protein
MTLGFIRKTPSQFVGAGSAPFRTGRWGDEPYGVLSEGLNFGNMGKDNYCLKSID